MGSTAFIPRWLGRKENVIEGSGLKQTEVLWKAAARREMVTRGEKNVEEEEEEEERRRETAEVE